MIGWHQAQAAEVTVRIDRGDGVTVIAEKLKGAGLIKSQGLFKLYTFFVGAAARFQPGIHTIDNQDSIVRIVRSLTAAPQRVSVVIPEGLTVRDIDVKLSELGIFKKGELVAVINSKAMERWRKQYWFLANQSSLEGFLFPDTFTFSPGSAAELVIQTLLDNFKTKAAPLLSGRKNWYTILILASLVEKEVPPAGSDRALVAGVLTKRLALGMPLQVDATMTYLKCGGAYVACSFRQLQASDFKIDSPYNTYLHRGLPPTPIANPGLSAIRAAIRPQASSYLFYLSDPKTEKTIFGRDFAEHTENKFRYLR